MSNALAIATVTATLRAVLNDAVKSVVSDAVATYIAPDAKTPDSPPGVNIYLYQATPNPAWVNNDLPTRQADGSLLQRPRTGLDLRYLLTFHGDDADLVPQLLLGAVALRLHAHPVLLRDRISQVAASETGSGIRGHFLLGSNLADQIERVRVTPANLSLEELSKLWMMFPNADYVLSAIYVASVVLIETDDLPPGSAPPVLRPRVRAVPFSLATIESVNPQPVALASPPAPTAITLVGNNLDPNSVATFNTPGKNGPLTGTIEPGTGGSQLIVDLPLGLHAGVNTVQLSQLAAVPSSPFSVPPSSPRVLSQSNSAAFILRPSIVSVSPGSLPGELVVVVTPAVGPQQQATLMLNQFEGLAPLAFALPAAAHPVETDTLVFADVVATPSASGPPSDPPPIAIPGGRYLARIRVDNAESALETDPASGHFNGPIVTIYS